MPKNWKSVIGDTDTPPKPSALAFPQSNFHEKPEDLSDLEGIAAQNPESGLSELIAQRKELENRMKELVGEKKKSYQESRFKVLSYADRVKDQKEWDAKRDRITGFRDQIQSRQSQFSHRNARQDRSGSALQSRPIEGGLTRGLNKVIPTSGLHRLNDMTRLKKAQDKLRERPEFLDKLEKGIGDIRGQIDKLSSDFGDLDKKLATHDIPQEDRDEINSLMKSKEVKALSSKLGHGLDKAEKVLSAPKKAADKLDNGWQNRRQNISGAMDRFGNYSKSRDRRLSSEFGGSGDIFARLAESRKAALTKQREKRRQEQLDQKRREKALERKRQKDRDNP